MDKLKALYYDPENGFVGLNELYRLSKEHNLNLSYKEVKEWYNNQTTTQVYKQSKQSKKYNKIIAPYFEIGCFQVDLMDVHNLYKENNGVNFLLNVVDIYSRYAFSSQLKIKHLVRSNPILNKL